MRAILASALLTALVQPSSFPATGIDLGMHLGSATASSNAPLAGLYEPFAPRTGDRYRLYILGTVIALAAEGVLIAGLLIERVRRKHADSALRRSYARVRHLGSRLLNAQEAERSYLARDLHDDIGQQLAVLKIELDILQRTLDGAAADAAAEAARRAVAIGTSIRDLSHRLHPARLRLTGLVGAITGLVSELSRPGLTITFTHEGIPPTLPPELTVSLFRIVQEGLQNALKYSEARHISVSLRGTTGEIALSIADDGVGFDVDTVSASGLGLISMRERAEALGGALEIHSGPGGGTMLSVRVPAGRARDNEITASPVRRHRRKSA